MSKVKLFPTKNQWHAWSMPSKLTAIGAYVGMFSVLLSLTFIVFDSSRWLGEDRSIHGSWYIEEVLLDDIPVDPYDKKIVIEKFHIDSKEDLFDLIGITSLELPFVVFSNRGELFLQPTETYITQKDADSKIVSTGITSGNNSTYYSLDDSNITMTIYNHASNEYEESFSVPYVFNGEELQIVFESDDGSAPYFMTLFLRRKQT